MKKKKKLTITKVLNVLMVVCLVFVVSVFGMIFISSRTKGVPQVFGVSLVMIASNSMLASGYEKGDRALVKEINTTKLNEGDIIAFYQAPGSKTIIFHQIIKITKSPEGGLLFQTKGTSNGAPDPWIVPQSSVIGRVIEMSSSAREVLTFMFSSTGLLILAIIPAAIILFMEMREFLDNLFAVIENGKKSSRNKKKRGKLVEGRDDLVRKVRQNKKGIK
ncbi:MAG: signal peptidase I [Christensenellaceae bacterium]|jgi:signal peptidase I|nr:signal peptidase I [Christensenellaceae bacterium]